MGPEQIQWKKSREIALENWRRAIEIFKEKSALIPEGIASNNKGGFFWREKNKKDAGLFFSLGKKNFMEHLGKKKILFFFLFLKTPQVKVTHLLN